MAEVPRVTFIIMDGGITPVAQPLDILVNKIFKGFYRELYDNYMLTAPEHKETGNPIAPTRQMISNWVVKAWEKVPEELVYKAWLVGGYKHPACATCSADGDELCTAIIEAKTDGERRDLVVKMVESVAGPDAVQHVVQDDFDGSDGEDSDDEDEMVRNGEKFIGDRVAKYFGDNIVLGTATNFGNAKRDGRVFPAWTIRFDKKVVVYEKERRKGYDEDLDIIEMEEALELYDREGKQLDKKRKREPTTTTGSTTKRKRGGADVAARRRKARAAANKLLATRMYR